VSKESVENSRKLWVVAVMAFWISVAVCIIAMVITGKLNLILVSITLGMMVLGVWLKIRYQLQKRKFDNNQTREDSL
jgi:uncharacterized membrane-anchored protein